MFGITRDGDLFVVVGDKLVYKSGGFDRISDINKNMALPFSDIMKVSTGHYSFNAAEMTFNNGTDYKDVKIVYDRDKDKTVEMTVAEIEKKLGIEHLKVVK